MKQKTALTYSVFIAIVVFVLLLVLQNMSLATQDNDAQFIFTENTDSTLTVKGIKDDCEELVIPEFWDGKAVTQIGDYAFYNNSKIKRITVPDSVTKIGASAFCGLKNLEYVDMGNGVEEIGESAFAACKELYKVDFSKALKTIRDYAFFGCEALLSAELCDELVSVGRFAFESATSLRNVKFGRATDKIGDHAFANCELLSEAVFLGSVPSSVGEAVFENTAHEFSIYFTNENKEAWENQTVFEGYTVSEYEEKENNSDFSYCDVDGGVELVLYNGSDLDVVIPESIDGKTVIGIGANTFKNTTAKTVETGDSVIAISENAFSNCHYLESVTFGKNVKTIGDNAFVNCSSLYEFNVSDENESFKATDGILFSKDGKSLVLCPMGKTGIIIINDNTEQIGKLAFSQSKADAVIMPEKLKTVGYMAFANSAMKHVNIPISVINLDKAAFFNCKNLESVNLPESISAIADALFFGCAMLDNVSLPKGVVSIGEEAFAYCEGLKNIELPQGIDTIGFGAFSNCTALESIILPDSLNTIEESAFVG